MGDWVDWQMDGEMDGWTDGWIIPSDLKSNEDLERSRRRLVGGE